MVTDEEQSCIARIPDIFFIKKRLAAPQPAVFHWISIFDRG